MTSRRRLIEAALGAAALTISLCLPVAAMTPDPPDHRAFPVVASNLAAKPWVRVAATSSQDTASLAVDGRLDTAWVSSGGHRQSMTVDLGGRYDNIRKIGVVFPDPDAGYRYVISSSSDGTRWRTLVDRSHSGQAGRGAVHLVTRPGIAYLRVSVTSGSPRGHRGRVGISELSVWNYLRPDVVLGADISFADQDSEQGLRYYIDDPAEADDILDTAPAAGMEYVRLRVFNDPRDERTGDYLEPAFQGPERTRAVARRVVDNGMGLGIDFHYADSWADPSKQPKPTAWRELPFNQLVAAVHDYTHDNVEGLIQQGTTPAKVAVGNELINGFMWGSERPQPWFDESAWCGSCYFNHDPSFVSQPGGAILWRYWKSNDPAELAAYNASWDRFVTLQAAGIRAVREAAAEHGVDIKVETHVIIDKGARAKTLEFWHQFLARLKAKSQDIDVIAHSYYPDYHGSPEEFEASLRAVALAHPGYLMEIAETSHPSNDYDGVPVPNSPYPKTPEGAGRFLQRVFQIVNDLPDNRGVGALVWEPVNWQEMIDWDNSSWPVLKIHETVKVFADSDAQHVLEDTIYRTARSPRALHLPRTVQVLDVRTGRVESVAVAWDRSEANRDARQVIINGNTRFGAVTAVIDIIR